MPNANDSNLPKHNQPAQANPDAPRTLEERYGSLPEFAGPDRARDGSRDPHLDNDSGNAARLIEAYGGSLRYCHAMKSWLIWDYHRWAPDYAGQAYMLAERAMQAFLRSVIAEQDRRMFALLSMNHSRIHALLAAAQPHLAISPADLDIHPDLLNFMNGTVDLCTATLYEHHPPHYLTRLVHYDYSPTAACPAFLTFLAQITAPHPGLADWLQIALGYSITGHTSERAVFFPYGPGANGKTTLLGLVRKLISEYSTLIQIDTLMNKQDNNNAQSDLADLRGARFVITSETDKGQRLAEGKLKRITQGTGGRIKTARKYENQIEFDETHKLWIDANNLPVVRGSDNAIWSRLHPIPFSTIIPPAEQNRRLQHILLEEAEGILAWLVEGARRWHAQHDLGRPPQVEALASDWRGKSDQISSFLSERCAADPQGRLTSSALFEAYEAWAAHEDDTPYTRRDFFMAITTRKEVQKHRLNDGMIYRLRLYRPGGRVGFSTAEQRDEPEPLG